MQRMHSILAIWTLTQVENRGRCMIQSFHLAIWTQLLAKRTHVASCRECASPMITVTQSSMGKQRVWKWSYRNGSWSGTSLHQNVMHTRWRRWWANAHLVQSHKCTRMPNIILPWQSLWGRMMESCMRMSHKLIRRHHQSLKICGAACTMSLPCRQTSSQSGHLFKLSSRMLGMCVYSCCDSIANWMPSRCFGVMQSTVRAHLIILMCVAPSTSQLSRISWFCGQKIRHCKGPCPTVPWCLQSHYNMQVLPEDIEIY